MSSISVLYLFSSNCFSLIIFLFTTLLFLSTSRCFRNSSSFIISYSYSSIIIFSTLFSSTSIPSISFPQPFFFFLIILLSTSALVLNMYQFSAIYRYLLPLFLPFLSSSILYALLQPLLFYCIYICTFISPKHTITFISSNYLLYLSMHFIFFHFLLFFPLASVLFIFLSSRLNQ